MIVTNAARLSILFLVLLVLPFVDAKTYGQKTAEPYNPSIARLNYQQIEDLPNEIGVAGPIVGVHNQVLIVAGGANFAPDDAPQLWDVEKKYLDICWTLNKLPIKSDNDFDSIYKWKEFSSFRLSEPIAYSAVVSTEHGVLVMGGNNSQGSSKRVFLLSATNKEDGIRIAEDDQIPDLPFASTGGGAAIVGGYVYLVAGEVTDDSGVKSASRLIWRFPVASLKPENRDRTDDWEQVVCWPSSNSGTGGAKMFPLVAAQHDGFGERLYVFGGRRFEGDKKTDANLSFKSDCWSFNPDAYRPDRFNASTDIYSEASPWRRLADSPVPLSAGTAVDFGQSHIFVPGYATGKILAQQISSGKAMKEFDHPGFPREAYSYHTLTDTWTSLGAIPSNPVTTQAVNWNGDIFLVSGEVSPRVRTNHCWRISMNERPQSFGTVNMVVVVGYLLAILGVGVFFTFRNKSTEDFFRGGKSIPWWAAGCSIFATMLSSITYMAVPAKAFAQDWVYLVGNALILAVAPIAIFIALPFFRRIDATSAYEYLEKRFNRAARWIASGSFSIFHIFRMGVVLALAALALSSVTPLSAGQCVLVMGVLSIVYCTLGGIEAVVWTDTLQTVILIGGALVCLAFAWAGSNPGSFSAAMEANKFHVVNWDFGTNSFTTMAIWVVIIGGFGQNIASYTADQAVVQRYMTTADSRQAARSIWLNGAMAIPAGLLFFGLGTAFWMFYHSHPEQLDPTMSTDRIMPFFISQQLPVGIAGLVVAGIFAAAQSTVSTSMNSGATTIATDFIKPIFKKTLDARKSDRAFLGLARLVTFFMGVAGTAAGLLFVDPTIKSLFDEFISLLGMFLGVLAGMFALGATTRRANGPGSLVGAATSITVMALLFCAAKEKVILGFEIRSIMRGMTGFELDRISGYLYAFIGIAVCYGVGYVASFAFPARTKLSGLTLYAKDKETEISGI